MKKSLFAPLFLLAAFCWPQSAPEWWGRDYDAAKFIVGRGEDVDKNKAANQALLEVAGFFGQDVAVTISTETLDTVSRTNGAESGESFDRLEAKSESQIDVKNFSLVQTQAYQGDDGVWRVLKTLDKARAQELYSQQVLDNNAKIDELTAQGEDDLDALAAALQAENLAVQNEVCIDRVLALNEKAANDLRKNSPSPASLQKLRKKIAASIPICAEAGEGEFAVSAAAVCKKAIAAGGFKNGSPESARYILRMDVSASEMRTSDGKFVYFNFVVGGSLCDARDGSVVSGMESASGKSKGSLAANVEQEKQINMPKAVSAVAQKAVETWLRDLAEYGAQ